MHVVVLSESTDLEGPQVQEENVLRYRFSWIPHRIFFLGFSIVSVYTGYKSSSVEARQILMEFFVKTN